MIGIGALESHQPEWLLVFNAAVRYAVSILAMIAIWTGLKEALANWRDDATPQICFTPQTYSVFYVNRVLIGLGIVLFIPSHLYRYGLNILQGLEVWVYCSQIMATLVMILYFLISETLRLVFTGHYSLSRAIHQSWAFVFATVLLSAVGAATLDI